MATLGNTILHKFLLLLVILAPLPLGSNREWSWTLCAFIAAVITLGWVLQALVRPQQQVSMSLKSPLIILFFGVCTWAWLQTVAWVPADWKHPLWGMNPEAVLPGSISLSFEDSLVAVMRLVCYGLVFFLAGRVPSRGEVIRHSSGVDFEVVDADPRRVRRLRILNVPSESEAEDGK